MNGSVVETSGAVDKETREFLGKAADGIVSEIFSIGMHCLVVFFSPILLPLSWPNGLTYELESWHEAQVRRSRTKVKVTISKIMLMGLSTECQSVIDEASHGRNKSRI